MKGGILLKVLEHLKDHTSDGLSLLRAFLVCGYGSSADFIYKEAYKEDVLNIKKNTTKDDWKKMNNRFLSMVSRLERDGLIDKSGDKGFYSFKITKKGKDKIKALKKIKKVALPSKNFKKEKSDKLSMVIFDIPEKEKRKRDWLRRSLLGMDFDMVQKSVWMGKVKIPKNFLETLRELKIIDFIEIFEITKTGSLKSLK